MAKLSTSTKYRNAVDAVHSLGQTLGRDSKELKAIAAFLIEAHDAEAPERVFAYVGDPGDARDIAVIRAFTDELQRLLMAEEEDWDDGGWQWTK